VGHENGVAVLKATEGAFVLTVNTTVCAAVPPITVEAGMLQEGGLLAAAGVMEQLKLTTPLKPLVGVSVMVEVLPDVAPALIAIGVPDIVKLGRLIVYVAVATGD
jgi:hypothetical protein